MLVREPVLNWYQPGASKEPVCISIGREPIEAKSDPRHYIRVQRDHVTVCVGLFWVCEMLAWKHTVLELFMFSFTWTIALWTWLLLSSLCLLWSHSAMVWRWQHSHYGNYCYCCMRVFLRGFHSLFLASVRHFDLFNIQKNPHTNKVVLNCWLVASIPLPIVLMSLMWKRPICFQFHRQGALMP